MSQAPDPSHNREHVGLSGPSAQPRDVIPRADLGRWLPTFKFFARRLQNNHTTSAAAALSYSTTLAVVPALALALASLAVFPAFDSFRNRIQAMIVDNLVPDTGMQINQALGKFIEAAGKLTAVGVTGLIATAILLLLTIEGQLNLIFGVSKPRPLVSRMLVLWAVVTLGPLALSLGLSLFGAFSAMHILPDTGAGKVFTLILGHLVPSLITWGLLTFVYDVVPHNRVHWKDAMIGAGIAALALAVLRYTFAFYVLLMTSYKAIYGALAAVPVFLVWIYFVWLIVMSGAVIAAAMPEWRLARLHRPDGPGGRLLLALETIASLAQAQRGGGGCRAPKLARIAGLPEDIVTVLLEKLRDGRFVVCSEDEEWVLSRDLDATTLSDLVHLLGFGLDRTAIHVPDVSAMARRLDQHIAKAAASEEQLLSVSLARLVSPE